MHSDNQVWVVSRRAAAIKASPIREVSKLLATRSGVISFAGGMPSNDALHVEAFRIAADRVFTKYGTAALQYGVTSGFGPLRDWVAQRHSSPGASVASEQVQILSGSQQGFDIVGKAFCERNSPLYVETPTYVGALQSFGLVDPEVVPVESDNDGLIPDCLEAAVRSENKGGGILYLVPTFQNPTGRTMPVARRQILGQYAAKAGLPILEDAPYDDLGFGIPSPPSLLSMAPLNVCHLGSFSKILSPGMRVGYLISPRSVSRKIEEIKQAADLHTSILSQMLIFELVTGGDFEDHLKQIRLLYRQRADAMLEALDLHFAGIATWTRPAGGMFLWLTLDGNIDAEQLVGAAIDAGVAFVPGAAFFARKPLRNSMRLNFSSSSPEEIHTGVVRLREVVRRALRDDNSFPQEGAGLDRKRVY